MHWPAWTEAWCSSTSGQFPGHFQAFALNVWKLKKSRPGRGMAPVKAKKFQHAKILSCRRTLGRAKRDPPTFNLKPRKQSSFVVIAIRCRRSLNSLFLFIFSWFPSFFGWGGCWLLPFLSCCLLLLFALEPLRNSPSRMLPWLEVRGHSPRHRWQWPYLRRLRGGLGSSS